MNGELGFEYESRPQRMTKTEINRATYIELKRLGFVRSKKSLTNILSPTPKIMRMNVQGEFNNIELRATLVSKKRRIYRVEAVSGATQPEIVGARAEYYLKKSIDYLVKEHEPSMLD